MKQNSIGKVLSELKGEKEYQFLCKYAKNKIILDFGCGPGLWIFDISRICKKGYWD